jgi:tetratricopeptide (TPR) repeat protein
LNDETLRRIAGFNNLTLKIWSRWRGLSTRSAKNSLLARGENKEALKAFEKTTKLSPQEICGWFNKGLSLELMEEYSEALRAYDKVLELKPDDTETQNRKADILKKLSRKQDMAV